nr:hypothetical protein [Streptomyces sp. SID8352]
MTAECRDPGGLPVTAASAAVTITLPDGTAATPPAAEDPAAPGTYHADHVTTLSGRHTVRWTWTGPASSYTDVFDVQEETPPAILSLADARQHLNLNSHKDDGEVRFWITATTRAVEHFVGPVLVREFTERHTVRNAAAVVLRRTPVVAVTAVDSVLSGTAAYPVDALDIDPDTGELVRLDGGWISGRLLITYRAGRAVIAENILGAARIILQHLWETQRASRGAVPGSSQDYAVTEPIPGLGYAIPNRALQLLEPDRLPPGGE